MKYINTGRTDEECLNNVIKYARKNQYINDIKKQIKLIKKEPIKEIRYIDNQYRIHEARKNWKKIISKSIIKNEYKSVKQELLEFFYRNQYKYNCYPCYDLIVEYDYEGNSYNSIYRYD